MQRTSSLLLLLCGLMMLPGCWNGNPFQFDLGLSGKVDYPEGDPRRSNPNATSSITATESASPSVTPTATPSANPNPELVTIYHDYNLTATYSPTVSSVVVPDGYDPPLLEMTKRVNNVYPAIAAAPTTAYLAIRVLIGLSGHIDLDSLRPGTEYFCGSYHSGDDYNGYYPGCTTTLYDVSATVKSFDGTVNRELPLIKSGTNYTLLGDLPLNKTLYIVAQVNDYKGYSLPFIMKPNLRTLSNLYQPVKLDMLITYDKE